MVLNGIGGRTVDEAKFNLSYVEYLDWAAFINRRGSINLGVRMEQGLAMVCLLLTQGFKIKKNDGQNFTLKDFLPHIAEDHDQELTVESVARSLGVNM